MDAEFWQQRWQLGEIGFHQNQVHRFLLEQLAKLHLEPDDRILVPLCGKSLDLAWLAEQGFEVVGVELSRLAIEAFFTEQQLNPQRTQRGPFEVWRQGCIELLEGDLFDLTPQNCGPLQAIYDRAALVALPEELRPRYAAKLAAEEYVRKVIHGELGDRTAGVIDPLVTEVHQRRPRMALDGAAGGTKLARKQAQERGLAAAVGADDGGPAGTEVQRNPGENGNGLAIGEVHAHEAQGNGHETLPQREVARRAASLPDRGLAAVGAHRAAR